MRVGKLSKALGSLGKSREEGRKTFWRPLRVLESWRTQLSTVIPRIWGNIKEEENISIFHPGFGFFEDAIMTLYLSALEKGGERSEEKNIKGLPAQFGLCFSGIR